MSLHQKVHLILLLLQCCVLVVQHLQHQLLQLVRTQSGRRRNRKLNRCTRRRTSTPWHLCCRRRRLCRGTPRTWSEQVEVHLLRHRRAVWRTRSTLSLLRRGHGASQLLDFPQELRYHVKNRARSTRSFFLSQTRAQLSVVGLSLTVKQLQLSVSKQSTSKLNQNETKRTCNHSPNSKALLTASACQHIRISKIKGKFHRVTSTQPIRFLTLRREQVRAH